MEKICPRCGNSSGTKRFFGDFCEDCYLGNIDLTLPMRIEIPFCKICRKVRAAKWEELNKKVLESIVKKNAKGNYESFHVLSCGGNQYEAVFLVSHGSDYFEVKRKFSLKMNNSTCEECSRETSGYYEAIVQIRGKNIDRWATKILKELRTRTFVSKYMEIDEGIDMYVGSRQAAAQVMGIFKLKPKVSDKLYGVKDGKRVYRRTYCIRF